MLLLLGGGAEGRLGASQIEILGFSRTATPLASRCGSVGKKVPRATSIPKERTYYRTSHELFYTVFTHELLTYQKSNEWDFIRSRMSGISDTKTSAYTPRGIVLIIYILRHSSFWQPFNFKSFQNTKLCLYTQRNDKQKEASAY